MQKRYSAEEETFWKRVVAPEEDRALFTTAKWEGAGYRWFKSSNIICLEHYRGIETNSAPQQKAS
jgi:hypothetical protein